MSLINYWSQSPPTRTHPFMIPLNLSAATTLLSLTAITPLDRRVMIPLGLTVMKDTLKTTKRPSNRLSSQTTGQIQDSRQEQHVAFSQKPKTFCQPVSDVLTQTATMSGRPTHQSTLGTSTWNHRSTDHSLTAVVSLPVSLDVAGRFWMNGSSSSIITRGLAPRWIDRHFPNRTPVLKVLTLKHNGIFITTVITSSGHFRMLFYTGQSSMVNYGTTSLVLSVALYARLAS